MTTPALLLRNIQFTSDLGNTAIYRYQSPSVPASTIASDIEFTFVSPGRLVNVRIYSDSPDYNFSLFLEPGVVTPTIEELYRVVGISNFDSDDQVDIWWAKPNGPDEHNLYGEIKNNAGVATGNIIYEFAMVRYF